MKRYKHIIVLLSIFMLPLPLMGRGLNVFAHINNDSLFCDSLERLLPELTHSKENELFSLKNNLSVDQYAFTCYLYAKYGYAPFKYTRSDIDLKCDSILVAGVLYLLQDGKPHGIPTTKIFIEYTKRLYANNEYLLSKGFCTFLILALELHDVKSRELYELYSLDCALDFTQNPEENFAKQYDYFKILREDYEKEWSSLPHVLQKYYKYELISQYTRPIEMAMKTNRVAIADTLIEEMDEYIYHEKEAAEKGVSYIIPTNPAMFRLKSLKADLCELKGDKKKCADEREMLLWRYFENWAVGKMPSSDFTDYFKALAYLLQTKQLSKKYCSEILDDALLMIKDYILNISPLVQSRLRNLYYEQAQALIYDVNNSLITSAKKEDLENLYNNALLFKGLKLAVASAEHLNMRDVHFEADDSIEDPIVRFTHSLVIMQADTWSSQRVALERVDIRKLLGTTWKNVQSVLRDSDIALEFVKTGDVSNSQYYAIALVTGEKSPRLIRLCDERILRDIAANINEETIRKLYRIIWTPILKRYHNVQHIYFSPDGLLHQLPLESALMDAMPNKEIKPYRLSSTKYLVEEHPRSSLQKILVYGGLQYDMNRNAFIRENEHDVLPLKTNRFRSIDVKHLRYGVDSLFYTKYEVENICCLFSKTGKKYKLLTGIEGSEKSFKKNTADAYDVIHLSTHGFYWDEEDVKEMGYIPFIKKANLSYEDHENEVLSHSGIIFSGANITLKGDYLPENIDDGVLLAKEIATLKLNNVDLVSLSACQTALGKITGEGVYGLQRGFKMAGVNSILMSLWKVDDEATQILMTEFYKNLLEGKTKNESLEKAEQYVRSLPNYEHPKYWAGFILLDALN